jgi:GTP cyclohydrolase I
MPDSQEVAMPRNPSTIVRSGKSVRGIPLSEVIKIADLLYPFTEAEPWDNCGIQIGDPSHHIDAIAFSLDATPETVSFARENACGLLICHHPLIFEPIRSIVPDTLVGRTLLRASTERVDILSLHTNLDSAHGGLNDRLAEIIGLEDVIVPMPARCARFGRLSRSLRVSGMAEKLVKDMNLAGARVIAREDRLVEKAFCVTGSGMGYLKEALMYNADLMITGDVKYHDAREALELGMPVIDAGHYGLEKIAIDLLSSAFHEQFTRLGIRVTCLPCHLENDPFTNIHSSGGL